MQSTISTNTKLRSYQETCVQKMLWGITLEGNSLLSVPTGGGKTLIIAEFVKRLGEPVLILVPSKELLEQDLQKLSSVVDKKSIGIFSASMNSKEVKTYTLATIQSAYKHPELFSHYKVVIIDEADLLNPKKLDGMYRSFFIAIGNPRVIGLSATCFRMDSYYRPTKGHYSYGGYSDVETVHTLKILTRYKQRFWQRILHVVHTEDLVKQRYLVPLTYYSTEMIDQGQLPFNKSKSDFDLEVFEAEFMPFLEKTATLIKEMPHKSVLVFCATINQAISLQELIPNSDIVTGTTPKKQREKMVADFRSGKLRVAINVGVLLIGFDKPDLEAIVIARPTRSLRLHSQLLGRGMRINEGKTTCHIYDLVGNVKTLGRAENLKLVKLENKWNLVSDTCPEGYHYKDLYTYDIVERSPTFTTTGET